MERVFRSLKSEWLLKGGYGDFSHAVRDINQWKQVIRKRTARAVLTGMCYSAGSAMRHGSSSLTRLTGQSAMTPSTWRR